MNRAMQSAGEADAGGGTDYPMGADKGGYSNNAIMEGQGANRIKARIAELEQELARRDS